MENQTAWEAIESQERWLRMLLRKTAVPPGVSRSDVLSEMRILLFEAFRNSYNPTKTKPSTFARRVFFRHIGRVVKRLTACPCESLTYEPPEPVSDDRLQAVHDLRASNSLNEVERYALDHLECFGRLTWADIRRRFPGEFAFDSAAELARKRKTYIDDLLTGIRVKL